MSNTRRNFCKNATYIGIGLGFSPFISYSKGDKKQILNLKMRAEKTLNISGKVCYEDLSPAKNTMIEVWHNNAESNPLKFEYEGKLITDSEGNYTFETDFPEKHFEDGYYRMRRIFFRIKGNNGQEILTKLYFGSTGKAFVDGFHVGNTHEKLRTELPKTYQENENFSKIQSKGTWRSL